MPTPALRTSRGDGMVSIVTSLDVMSDHWHTFFSWKKPAPIGLNVPPFDQIGLMVPLCDDISLDEAHEKAVRMFDDHIFVSRRI